jgi:flagellar basal body P-ring formation protein FlgA
MKMFMAVAIAGLSALAQSGRAQEPVAVPRATIYPGEIVHPDMIVMVERRGRRGALAAQSDAAGRVARRTLLAGEPIPLAALKVPDVVRQGAVVKLVYDTDVVMITAVGTALQAGGAGAMISVQMLDSGAILRGEVGADGAIRVLRP